MRKAIVLRGPAARRRPDRFPVNSSLPTIYRRGFGASSRPSTDPLARDDRLARLEAALLLADEPMNARRLVAVAALRDTTEAKALLGRLAELYDADESAFQLTEIAGGYQLFSRAEFHPWLARLRRENTEVQLSTAALDTLTIVAYRQPITRADVEQIRGVSCGELLNQLMEKGLVRVAGRDQSLGRPVLYGTTKKFLQEFGLKSLSELPAQDGT